VQVHQLVGPAVHLPPAGEPLRNSQAFALPGRVAFHQVRQLGAAITRALYSQLPSQMRTVRELKGSPPERLYWTLATQESLGGLERTLS
jgi:hypothetical protein